MKNIFFLFILFIGFIKAVNATDIRSSNCEIFVDKVAKHKYENNGYHKIGFDIYVKLNLQKLDGNPINVFFHTNILKNHKYGQDNHGWKNLILVPHENSDHYYTLSIDIAEIGTYSTSYFYEGAFYVETNKGTKYWANTSKQNFIFDETLYSDLWNYKENIHLNNVPTTSSFSGPGIFLNPQRCR